MVSPTRINAVTRAATDYACVRRLSDGVEWELTLAQYAALGNVGAGQPPNVSAGALSDADWLAAWQANALMAYRDYGWSTATKRLDYAEFAIIDTKLRLGLGNGRVATVWPAASTEAIAQGVNYTGSTRNNLTVVSARSLPFTLVSGILTVL